MELDELPTQTNSQLSAGTWHLCQVHFAKSTSASQAYSAPICYKIFISKFSLSINPAQQFYNSAF